VPVQNVNALREVAIACGYQPTETTPTEVSLATAHHLAPLLRNGVRLEIHWRLLPPGYGEISTDDVLRRAQPLQIQGRRCLGLSPEDLLLHICAHASHQHLFEQRLRALFDVVMIARRFGPDIDWAAVAARAREWGVHRGTALCLDLARTMGSAAVPLAAIEMIEPNIPHDVSAGAMRQIFRPVDLQPISHNLTRLMDPTISLRARVSLIARRGLLLARSEEPAARSTIRFRISRLVGLLTDYTGRLARMARRDRKSIGRLAEQRNAVARWLNPTL
jgi:hypothetical protein